MHSARQALFVAGRTPRARWPSQRLASLARVRHPRGKRDCAAAPAVPAFAEGDPKEQTAMSYIYIVQMDIPAQYEADFNRIYDTEHVPMLSKVPGVTNVTRYRLEKSNDSRMQKYLA